MMFRDDNTVSAPKPPPSLLRRPRIDRGELRDNDDAGQGEPTEPNDIELDVFDGGGTRNTVDDEQSFGEDHCEDTRCELPKGHSGPHSYERVGTRREGAKRVRKQTQPSEYERGLSESSADFPNNWVRILMEDSSGHFINVASNVDLGNVSIPKTYEEATASRFVDKWREAMTKEIKALILNKTWKEVDRCDVPHGKSITKSRWVFDLKFLRDGTIERFKARFVACGYSQILSVSIDASLHTASLAFS